MKISNIFRKGLEYLTDEDYRIAMNSSRFGMYHNMPDAEYLKRIFRYRMGYDLDLDKPKTFNEKLQWLKLYDRRPEYTTMVDKYEVKAYVSDRIGEQYIIPTLGVWNHFDEIDFDELPDRFVLKCTHDSGGLSICKDKVNWNKAAAKEKLEKSLKRNYYYAGREWPYKNVTPRIIAEQYMQDEGVSGNTDLTDYKFYCFNSNVDCVMVCYDRGTGDTKFYFFDPEWKLKRINKRGKEAPSDFSLPKPVCIDEMFEIAAKLSKNIPFVRVDLYQSNNQVYFGEMTFYPQSGWDPNYLPETDLYFGSLIDLSLSYSQK